MPFETNCTSPNSQHCLERHIMRRDEVERKTGFKRAHIYNLMKEGKFPQVKRISMRAVGWDSQEIEQWIVERLGQQD
ncbi:AlpA family transcriptional regulator [Pseudomonas tolaasii]